MGAGICIRETLPVTGPAPSGGTPEGIPSVFPGLFAIALAIFSVLYLLPSNVAISAYSFIDRHVGLQIGIVAISDFAHFSSFALLALLSVQAFQGRYLPLAMLAVFAVVIEALQEVVPHRSGDMGDLKMNLIGLAAGLAVFWVLQAMRRVS